MTELVAISQDNTSLSLQQKAELDVQITTAKAFPRDVRQSHDAACAMATISEDVAKSCLYALPRAGKFITGPSVRLAEIIANCWGNLHSGYRIISNDGKNITAEAVVWDLEKNNKISVQVSRSIRNKKGEKFTEDMQVVTGNAAGAIAYRNAIFKVLPRSLCDSVLRVSQDTAIGKGKPLSVRVDDAISSFKKMGVSEENLLLMLERGHREEITADDISVLIGLFNAIKEGSITVDSLLNKNQVVTEKNSKAKEILQGVSKESSEANQESDHEEPDEFMEALGDIEDPK